MKNTLFSMKETAAILKVPSYKIAYLLNMGRVPEPETWLSHRRAFSPADIRRLAAKLGVVLGDDLIGGKEAANG